MDKESVKNSLNYHGQQFTKLWETERGSGELEKLGASEVDYSVYQERSKHFSLQDRGKRLKVHQFIVRRAEQLFDSENLIGSHRAKENGANENGELVATTPPYELFLPLVKSRRVAHFYRCVQPGELLICSVSSKMPNGFTLKVLCGGSQTQRYVADLNIRAFLLTGEMLPGGVVYDKKGQPRQLMSQDTVRVKLLEVVRDSAKLYTSLLPDSKTEEPCKALGLVFSDDLPDVYKPCVNLKSWQVEWSTMPDKIIEKSSRKSDVYSELMETSVGFNNPSNSDLMEKKLGINTDAGLSMMKSLKHRFPLDEYSGELRKSQNAKWALQSVNEGILHFKAGRTSDAFQCLNSALSIDPINVEGLVARGALCANNSSFQKAIDDFQTALKVDPSHPNAKKYLAETLVAFGRQQEDENSIDQAVALYNQCLSVVPYHKEAMESLRFLENKLKTPGLRKMAVEKQEEPNISVDTSGLLMPGFASKSREVKVAKEEKGHSSRKKKKDRKKKKSKKRRHRSSSTSSSSSSDSSSSSSSSSSSQSSSGSDSEESNKKSNKKKKNKKHSKEKHEKSLSPFTKKLLMEKGIPTPVPAPPQQIPMYVEKEPQYQQYKSADTTPVKEGKEKGDFMDQIRLLVGQYGDQIGPGGEDKLKKLFETMPKSKEKDGKKKKKKDKKQKDKGKKKKEDKKGKKKEVEEVELGTSLMSKKKDDTDSSEEEERPKKASKKMDLGPNAELGDLGSKLNAYYAKMEEKTGRKRVDAKEASKHKEDEYGGYSQQKPVTLYSPEADYLQEDPRYAGAGQKEQRQDYVAMPPSKWDHPGKQQQQQQQWGYEQNYEYGASGQEYRKEPSPVAPGRFAGFRINKKEEKLEPSSIMMPDEAPPSPPPKVSDDKYGKMRGSSRSRSRSRSYSSRGSGGGQKRRRSGSRSRSRSGSYRRRSRSRSYSRSRSRSASYERKRRWVPRRGTFYKPAFRQNYTRPFRGRFNNRRPFRPYNRGRGGGRFFHNRRRFSRSRSRSNERRSYDRHHSSGSDNERGGPRREREQNPRNGGQGGGGGGNYSDREMDVPLPPGPPPDSH